MSWWSEPTPRTATRLIRSATVNGAAHPARLLVDARRHRSGSAHLEEEVEDLPDPLEVLAEELDAVKAAGIAEGYRQATDELADAAAEARLRRAAEVTRAVSAFAQARSSLDEERLNAAEIVQGDVAALAFALTETILGRELALATSPGVDAVQRAMALAPDGDQVVVRLNPVDYRVVQEELDGSMVTHPGMSLVPDETVEPSGAIVDVGPCRIDAQISPALERVRQALGVPTAARWAATVQRSDGEFPDPKDPSMGRTSAASRSAAARSRAESSGSAPARSKPARRAQVAETPDPSDLEDGISDNEPQYGDADLGVQSTTEDMVETAIQGARQSPGIKRDRPVATRAARGLGATKGSNAPKSRKRSAAKSADRDGASRSRSDFKPVPAALSKASAADLPSVLSTGGLSRAPLAASNAGTVRGIARVVPATTRQVTPKRQSAPASKPSTKAIPAASARPRALAAKNIGTKVSGVPVGQRLRRAGGAL